MKTTLLLLFLLIHPLLFSQDKVTIVENENQKDYTYSNLHKMTFEEDAFTLYFKDGTNEAFTFSDVQKLLFHDDYQNNLQYSTNRITSLELFPNPVDEVLKINYTGEHKIGITIVNLQGKRMLQQTYNNNGTLIAIDIAQYESGLYLLHIRDESHSESSKLFIKQ